MDKTYLTKKMIKKIGLIYSLSGTISIVGEGQLQASLLAIEEVNKKSGVKFDYVIRDAKSDPLTAAKEAYSLFKDSKIDILLGCYMSSERNSIIPVLNEIGGLLLYPTLYEGEQVHPNIFYLGAVPNQQVEPLLSWAINNLCANFILVGSDYVYPRSTNRQVRQWVENAEGTVLLETYFPLGCSKFNDFFSDLNNFIETGMAFVIFSTLVGSSVVSFYQEHKRRKIPFSIISPITSEREIQKIGKEASCGHICTSAYFQTIETELNKNFVNAFKNRFGDQPISREMAASYDAIHLLALAYDRMPIFHGEKKEAENIRMALKNLSFQGIQGKVILDPKSQHLWQWSRIGKVNPNGQIESFWESSGPIPPRVDVSRIGLTIREDLESSRDICFRSLIGANKKFLESIKVAKIAAITSSNILITGETGTGKELFARAIHSFSDRHSYLFVPINCASIPRDLIGSELFGYEEGAFTGAKKGGKKGKFELANGGTLFLDEIGEMPIDMQAVLLRVIEENELYKLGGTEATRINVRVIASTNKDIFKEIAQGGSFRKDLYYRLSAFHINLPNLCDRADDIPILASYFVERYCYKNATVKSLLPETIEILNKHSWPGNVRELANVIESSFFSAVNSKVIRPDHLPDYITNPQHTIVKRHKKVTPTKDCSSQSFITGYEFSDRITSLKEAEVRFIERTLCRNDYNIMKTAYLLGISRNTLYRKIKRYKVFTNKNILKYPSLSEEMTKSAQK